MPFDNERKPIICDGCRVKPPYGHRCHKDNAYVMSFSTGKACECEKCKINNKAALFQKENK